MLDLGWTEMLAIGVVALFVIGPRDLPKAMRTVGRYVAKIRGMAREFQNSIDDAVRDTELEEVKNAIAPNGRVDVTQTLRRTVDPDQELSKALDFNDTGAGAKSETADPKKAKAGHTDPAAKPAGKARAEDGASPKPSEQEETGSAGSDNNDSAKAKPVVSHWPSSRPSPPADPSADDTDQSGAKAPSSEPPPDKEQSKAGA